METNHRYGLKWAIIACGLAVIISPLVTLLSGSPNFSALVLLSLGIVIWLITWPTRSDMGLSVGRPGYYGLAVAYPLIVMGLLMILVWRIDGISRESIDGRRTEERHTHLSDKCDSVGSQLGIALNAAFLAVVWTMLLKQRRA